MMRIKTDGLAAWNGITVVLEFQHYPPYLDGRRDTGVRLVEVSESQPRDADATWRQAKTCWKRTVYSAFASCSPLDQYCRETGRRIALCRLAKHAGVGLHKLNRRLAPTPIAELVAAATKQYYMEVARQRRERAELFKKFARWIAQRQGDRKAPAE